MVDKSSGIYAPLPTEVQRTVVPVFRNNDPFVKSFLASMLPESDHPGIDDGLWKTFPLARLGRRTVPRRKGTGKGALLLRERRRLGLYQLRRKGASYVDVLSLHQLWQQYMQSVLRLGELEKMGFEGKPTDRQWEQVSLALYRADYHGAALEVTRAKCGSLVGVSGIVLMDTKNTFKLIGRDNIVRTVPKQPCVFTMNMAGYRFTIYGKNFCVRPAERSVKKIKSQSLADL